MGERALAIETHGLTRRFGDVVAVDHVDLAVCVGETFALLGRRGAGKTTAIRMLCLLLEPSSGSLRIAGHDLGGDPLAIKRSIALSPQGTAISERLDAWENLGLMARLHGFEAGETRDRSGRLLDLFGLIDRAHERVRRYSASMKRRLSIAMALVSEPQVLFLDEPTSGLDPRSRRGLWTQIGDVQGSTTIVLTTHDLEEADSLADRIAIIDRGRIVAEGTSAQLEATVPRGRATVVEAELDDLALGALRARFGAVHETSTGAEIDDPNATLDAVLAVLRPLGVTTRATFRTQPTLDDVFTNLTGDELRR